MKPESAQPGGGPLVVPGEADALRGQLQLCLDLGEVSLAEFRAVRDDEQRVVDFIWTRLRNPAGGPPAQPGVEPIGQKLLADAGADQRARNLFQQFAQVCDSGERKNFEFEGFPPFAAGLLKASVVAVNEGVVLAWISVARRQPLTGGEQAESAGFRAVFANTVHLLVLLDPSGRIQAFNDTAARGAHDLLGVDLRVGRHIREVVPASLQASIESDLEVAMAGTGVRGEQEVWLPGEQRLWFEVFYTPVRGADGTIQNVLLAALPITERKRQERRREAQREAAVAIAQAGNLPELVRQCATAGHAVAGLNGGLLFLRDPVGDCFTLAAPEPLPDGWPKVPSSAPVASELGRHLEAGSEALTQAEAGTGFVTDLVSCTWRRWVFLPIPALAGTRACVVMGSERTEPLSPEQTADLQNLAQQAGASLRRFQAEEQARLALVQEQKASQLKGRFLSLASHEFRNPLTVIGASAELLQRHLDQLTEAKRRQLLELIRSSAQRMRVMLDEVIDVGRANSGMESCHPELLDLGALVRASLDEMRLVDCGQHQFLFDCPENLAPVPVDTRILRHILGNLLNNAMNYSEHGTAIETTVAVVDRAVQITLRDHGVGIPPEDRERIWLAFERGSNVRTSPGSGLGLYLAKHLSDLHGIKLDCDSALGQGTTFTLRFPPITGPPGASS